MSEVFISYAREDRDRVQTLAHALEAEGWSVWWDRLIAFGEDFDRVIEKALAEARCVIVVWSRHSVESNWVRSEATEAYQRTILLPVRFDRSEAPLAFRRVQTADLVEWNGDVLAPEFLQVSAGVRALIQRRAASRPPPPPSIRRPASELPAPRHEPAPPPIQEPVRGPEPVEPARAVLVPPALPTRSRESSGPVLRMGVAAGVIVVAGGLGLWAWLGRGEGVPQAPPPTRETVAMTQQAAVTQMPAQGSPGLVPTQSPEPAQNPPDQRPTPGPSLLPPIVEKNPASLASPAPPLPVLTSGTRSSEQGMSFVYVRNPGGKDFWIGATEVTQRQWAQVLRGDPSHHADLPDDAPVENVSWYETLRFANELSRRAGLSPCYRPEDRPLESVGWNCRGYRLPTQGEWELAARAGAGGPFYTGRFLGSHQANFASDCTGCLEPENPTSPAYRVPRPTPVATFPANAWGLYDVHGNVWEWTWEKVARGGGYDSPERECHFDATLRLDAEERHRNVGLRLVRTAF